MESVRFAVIGGSGLYNMPELTNVTEQTISTPFGPTSDSIMIGTLAGQRVAFLPRHGRGDVLTPSEVPYRANIYALKSRGTSWCLTSFLITPKMIGGDPFSGTALWPISAWPIPSAPN